VKLPPLEQRKKRGFCKFHGFLGHNLSRCTRFRDYVQKALDEGILKFGDKAKQPMQVDADPLKKADSIYAEIIDINMVDIVEDFGRQLPAEKPAIGERPQATDEMVTDDHRSEDALFTEDQHVKKMEVAYPKAEEDLIDFPNRCKISNNHACSVLGAAQFSIRRQQNLSKDSYRILNAEADGWKTAQSTGSTREVSHIK